MASLPRNGARLMPAAPKDDGSSRRPAQTVSNIKANPAASLTATFLPQSEHWSIDAGTVAYDVIPGDYHASDPARYQAPLHASNEESLTAHGGGPLDASILTSNTTAAAVASDPSLGSFQHRSPNQPSFYFDAVDAFQHQDEHLIDIADTDQYNKEATTTALSISRHPQVTHDNRRSTPTGLKPSPALSVAGKGSLRPAVALLRPSIKRKGESTPILAIGESTGQPTDWAGHTEHADIQQRMSNSTHLLSKSGHRSVDASSRDQLATKTTNSIPSTAASASGDEVESNGNGGSMVSIETQRAGGPLGVQPPGILQAGRSRQAPHPQSGLPAEKVFPIQIGSELFRLSGASIASDGEYSA